MIVIIMSSDVVMQISQSNLKAWLGRLHPSIIPWLDTRWCPIIQWTLDYYIFSTRLCLVPSFSWMYISSLHHSILYIVQPFPFWSSSFCFPFHLSEHHLLYQSAIFHSTEWCVQISSISSRSLFFVWCFFCYPFFCLFLHSWFFCHLTFIILR